MQLAQYITDGCIVVVAVAGLVSHLSHNKKVQQVAQRVEDVAQKVEQKAPAVAQIVQTGLVQQVKPEQK